MFSYFSILLFTNSIILTRCLTPAQDVSTGQLDITTLQKDPADILKTTETFTVNGQTSFVSEGSFVSRHDFYSRDSSTMSTVENSTNSDLLHFAWEFDLCKAYTTCNYTSQQKFPQCQCDQSCFVYKDCCYDMLVQSTNTELKSLPFTCVQVDSGFPPAGVYIVKNCPEDFQDHGLKTNCSNDDIEQVGSWVVDDNKTIFKNRYCARCHGVFTFTALPIIFTKVLFFILFTDTYINMSPAERFSYLYDAGRSTYSFDIPPESRRCVVLDFDNEQNSLCMQYAMSLVTVFDEELLIDKRYRNMYCIPTKYRETSETECIKDDYQEVLDFSPGFGLGYYQLFPLTVLFSFEEDRNDCGNLLSCPPLEEYSNLLVDLSFSIAREDHVSVSLLRQFVLSLAWSIYITNETFITDLVLWSPAQGSNGTSPVVFMSVILRRKSSSPTQMAFFEEKLKNITWMIQVNNEETREEWKVYTGPLENKIYEVQRSEFVWVFKNDDDLPQVMRRYNMNMNALPRDFICDTIFIRSDLSNYSLTIEDVNCINEMMSQSSKTAKLSKTGMIFTYLTYTGCSLSIFTLILSIIFCRKYHVTNSIHGTNLENLSIALILAKLLFLVGIGANDNQQICSIIGISLHYVWLAVFSFKSVAIVFLMQDIRKMSKQRSETDDNLCCLKCCFTSIGAFIPALLVVPSVVLQYIFESPISPRYGGPICFPSAYPANMIFVSGPIMLSIIINTICLVLVIVFISRNNEKAKSIRRFDSFPQVKVYLRISLITGVFWISGILSSLLQEQILDYIFVITCSLQGFFIAIANMTTKRVSGRLKKSLKQLTSTRSGLTTSSSKQTTAIKETTEIEDPAK